MSNFFLQTYLKIEGQDIVVDDDKALLVCQKYKKDKIMKQYQIFGEYKVISKRYFVVLFIE